MARMLLGLMVAAGLLLSGCAMDMTASQLQTNAQNGVYEVDGAVLHPGTFHLPPGQAVTLRQAIKRCGGPWPGDVYNDGGDISSVHLQRIVHGSVVEYTFDANAGGRGADFMVKPGDFIRVPKMTYSTNVPIPAPFAD